MTHNQYYFDSSNNDRISAHIWRPDGNVKAVMIICHGMAEHIKRYEKLAEFLAGYNILSCGIDYPGHGDSVGECLGFFAYKKGAQYVADCILKLIYDIKKQYPGVGVVLFGHSMGSFFARYIASNFSSEIDSFIFCGTSGPVKILKLGKLLAKTITVCKGAKHASRFIDKMTFNPYNKQFKPNRTPFDWLNRDDTAVDKYIADDKCGFIFTCGGFYDMFDLLDYINSKKCFDKLDKNKPYLIISGKSDALGNFGEGVEKVYDLMKADNIEDVTIKLYKDARHEILHELNYMQVYKDIADFITTKLDLGK